MDTDALKSEACPPTAHPRAPHSDTMNLQPVSLRRSVTNCTTNALILVGRCCSTRSSYGKATRQRRTLGSQLTGWLRRAQGWFAQYRFNTSVKSFSPRGGVISAKTKPCNMWRTAGHVVRPICRTCMANLRRNQQPSRSISSSGSWWLTWRFSCEWGAVVPRGRFDPAALTALGSADSNMSRNLPNLGFGAFAFIASFVFFCAGFPSESFFPFAMKRI